MQVVLFVTVMLVDLPVAIIYVTVSVEIIQLEVCPAIICKWQFQHWIWRLQFLLYFCRWESLLQLCRWYFLQCATVSLVKCILLFLHTAPVSANPSVLPNTPSWNRITELISKWRVPLILTVEINWCYTKNLVKWPCKPVFYAFMCCSIYNRKSISLGIRKW